MATIAKLKVDDLRNQLSTRGLDTTGTKPILVKRLEEAIEEENKKKLNGDRKRSRVDNFDSIGSGKMNAVEDFKKMSVKELRELATSRGISSNGSKKELVERLCASADSQNNESKDDLGGIALAIQNLVTATEKGAAVLDQYLPDDIKTRYHVLQQGTEIYDATLNQTNVGNNNDKFYIIQVLESDSGGNFLVYSRWGRVGVKGGTEINGPYMSADDATSEFERKFYEKTKNYWSQRKDFFCQPKQYAWSEMDYDGNGKESSVKRLEEAIEEANKKQLNGDRKRSRVDSDLIGSRKMNAVEEYKKMSVKELREVATSRGISSTGSKKELVERLSDSQNNESKDDLGATKKGAAVLDQYLPDDIKTRYHVLQQGKEIYDATLNQTNVGNNNNKFYIIQVLENDSSRNFLVYTRWGRVGAKGGTKINGPYMSANEATSEFESKFYEKTKNYWSNRKDFVCQPKQYAWLEMDYDDNGKESSVQGQSNQVPIQPRETKLEAPIAKFISLICDINMMRQQMMEIGYNANKLPLGKLSKTTILKGYDVLKRISDVIGQSNRTLLEDLSSKFYTVIPHDFGFYKMREFVIDTPQKLKRKIEMVEALAEIEVATKLLEDNTKIQEDPLYYQYEQLRCKLIPVEIGSQEFQMIENYMKNTHAKTHSGYAANIVQVFRASREGETERFQKFFDTSNRMLLWHGSRLTNWAGILSQGLRIAPPEAPSTGYMFGKGVYFADMFSKSANYCFASSSARDGVLLLCEVALGDMNELLSANCNADKLPSGKLSTKGVGATAPDFEKAQVLEDGVIVPLGNPKEQPNSKGSLLYNEYIVYNVEQIRMRYVIHVEFNYGR
ncbi:poly [ADP-ribose] polymerase 2 isoform X2 [Lycium ferocissimum]|uniref:poly [ADP-ribose] polymerase 2 isoform X2 n=1 Tax=Lycium ferocissimum TaxID=112874 RepID=UPI002816439D|nr:poly [ADP-ribose] polymerase 2 isoform X2 [Lycium ferocissimum]